MKVLTLRQSPSNTPKRKTRSEDDVPSSDWRKIIQLLGTALLQAFC